MQKVTIRVKSKEKVITGCWVTEERMRTELKYSKCLGCHSGLHRISTALQSSFSSDSRLACVPCCIVSGL